MRSPPTQFMCYTFLLLRISARVLTFRFLCIFNRSRSMSLQTDSPACFRSHKDSGTGASNSKKMSLRAASLISNLVLYMIVCHKDWVSRRWTIACETLDAKSEVIFFTDQWWNVSVQMNLPTLAFCPAYGVSNLCRTSSDVPKGRMELWPPLLKCISDQEYRHFQARLHVFQDENCCFFFFFFSIFCCLVVLSLLCFPSHLSVQRIHRNLVPKHP